MLTEDVQTTTKKMLLSGNNDPKQINACVCRLAIVCYSRIGQEDEENLNL